MFLIFPLQKRLKVTYEWKLKVQSKLCYHENNDQAVLIKITITMISSDQGVFTKERRFDEISDSGEQCLR